MNIATTQPQFKAQRVTQNMVAPMVGCIYSGDAGNSEWHTGMLVQVDGDEAIICDVRLQDWRVILSTIRSIQATE